MQKISFLLFGLFVSFNTFSQSYKFVIDSFPTLNPIDTIDINFITSLDTANMIDIFKDGIKVLNHNGNVTEYKNQKNHAIGKFFKDGYCWALIVTDFTKSGANASRTIQLTVHDSVGNVIGGQPIGLYVDMMHTILIEECFFFDNGFKITTSSKSTRYKMTEKEEKIFRIMNNSLTQIK